MYKLEIQIEGAPLTLNEIMRKNWKAKWQQSKKWQQLVDVAILKAGGYPAKPLKRARIEFTRLSHRSLDHDNLVGSFKPVLDALKSQREQKAGINKAGKIISYKPEILRMIEDDSAAHVELHYRHESAPRGQKRIKIVIEEI